MWPATVTYTGASMGVAPVVVEDSVPVEDDPGDSSVDVQPYSRARLERHRRRRNEPSDQEQQFAVTLYRRVTPRRCKTFGMRLDPDRFTPIRREKLYRATSLCVPGTTLRLRWRSSPVRPPT